MNDMSYVKGLQPRNIEILEGFGQILGSRTLVYIDRANIVEAHNDTWSYTVPFRIIGEDSGTVLPLNQTVAATVALTTGTGPTPVVSTATPTVTWGSGSVVVSHGDTGYDTGDVVTLTITYTNVQGATDTDTWTITFS